MLKDALGDCGALAGFLSVVAPHDALQTRHFDDHLAGKVGFTQFRHAVNGVLFRFVQAQVLAQFLAKILNAVGFSEHGAELLLEG